MDKSKLSLLLAEYRHREMPKDYVLLSPAAEVAALLKEHSAEKQKLKAELARQAKELDQVLAEVTGLAYLFDEATARFQPALEEQGLKRMYRELRVLKDKLIQTLQEAGYTWRNPLGEPFEGDLPELVNVDGWRYDPEYEENRVAQVREPIILKNSILIKEGSVVVGAPEQSEQINPTTPAETLRDNSDLNDVAAESPPAPPEPEI
jgi:hypothetical protein